MSKSHLEIFFHRFLIAQKLDALFTREYHFHPLRKWRFDFADAKNKIAVELEGGVWVEGRHNRGSGFTKDAEKYNEAASLGWRILRYTSQAEISDNFLHHYLTAIGGIKK
jgi:very-short-patch-repair endonuclease